MECGEEVAGELVEAGGDAAHIFEAAEEALDDIAQAVEPSVMAPLTLVR